MSRVLPWTTTPQLTAPPAANLVSLTGPNSGWVTVLAGGPTLASVLTGVTISNDPAGTTGFELDIGYGAAGFETALFTVTQYINNSTTRTGVVPIVIPVGPLPAGVRIAARIRNGVNSGGAPVAWTYYIGVTYLAAALVGVMDTTTSVVVNVVFTAVTTNASAWTNSAWAQLIASTTFAIVVHSISIREGNANLGDFEVDLGVGGAGSEVVVTTFRGRLQSVGCPAQVLDLPVPLDNIPASSRVSFRVRQSVASAFSQSLGLHYWNKPL